METTNQPITDVEFKDVESPPDFLTRTMREAGIANPDAWEKDLDPAARTSHDINHQLFLTNRSLALHLSEVADCGDNIIPRMFISERQIYENWKNIITEGVVPWLLKQFDRNTGKRIPAPTIVSAEDFSSSNEPADIAAKINAISGEARNTVGTLESDVQLEVPVNTDPEADQQAVVDAEEQEPSRGNIPGVVNQNEFGKPI